MKMEGFKSETTQKNEPMDVNEEPAIGFYENKEINSSDNEKNLNFNMPLNAPSIFPKENNKEFVTGFNVFDKDEELKKLGRAKRFSLPVKTVAVEEVHQEWLSSLYAELGIDKESVRHYRFNALHMRGTENMSTDDVLQYFISYAPSHVEWINDVSCNIVWLDDVSAARALLSLTKKIKNLDKVHLNADPFKKDLKSDCLNKNENDDDSDDENAVDAKKIKVAIPPGIWRIGVPCEKNSSLLLRFATRSDKKHKNAEKNSEYYKKYGNPHYGNIPGLISNSFRFGFKKSKIKGPDSLNNFNKYTHEDSSKSNPWEELAYEWGKTDKVESTNHNYVVNKIVQKETQIPDLRISLTNKKEKGKVNYKDLKTNSHVLEKQIWSSKNKTPRMKMYADEEEKKKQGKNLNNKYQTRPLKRHAEEDLRTKISMKKSKLRFKFRSEKEIQDVSSGECSTSENENEDEESSDWAFVHYHDLRESLQHNKKKNLKCNIMKNKSESEGDADVDDKLYKVNINQWSPLQIEIENDEYYHNKVS